MRSTVLLALVPASCSFYLPARQARLPRAARIVLQETEPDEYIPGLDLEVHPPLR